MPIELLRFEMLLPAFGLVLARVAGVVLAVPMMASSQIPRSTKVWLVATLSLLAFPVVAVHVPTSLTLGQAAAGMVGEFIIGEVLGFGAGLAFFGAQIAGKLVSHQSGMALGTVFNPIFDAESTVIDQIWFFTALMVFLALGGHVAAATVLFDSFAAIPPMSPFLLAGGAGSEGLLEFVGEIMREMFDLSLRLAGPAVAALLITSLVMGFITKTMPQLNILSVGFSFKIATALLIVAVTIAHSGDVLGAAVMDGMDYVRDWLAAAAEDLKDGG